uniref:Uncharacterized protein n=1 Tax=Molossus molossus TaxID=27622 RepID=A0A7J8HHN4_MOLMO|nr:hypothetical protein HJG59_010967 [Molossus molossus]
MCQGPGLSTFVHHHRRLPLPSLSRGPVWLLGPSGLHSYGQKGERGRKRNGTHSPFENTCLEVTKALLLMSHWPDLVPDHTVPKRRPHNQLNTGFPSAKKKNIDIGKQLVMLITCKCYLWTQQCPMVNFEIWEPDCLGSALPLTSQVMLGNLLNFSVPQFLRQ